MPGHGQDGPILAFSNDFIGISSSEVVASTDAADHDFRLGADAVRRRRTGHAEEDLASPAADGSMRGHEGGSGHLAAAGDDSDSTVSPFMAVRAAGHDDFSDIRFLQQISRVFFELHEQRTRHADGVDFNVAGTSPAGIEDQAPFEGTKGDGHIGKERTVFIVVTVADSPRIGVDASRHIDGDDRDGTGGGSGVDFRYDRGNGLAQAAVEARPQHGVDDDRRGEEPFLQDLPVSFRLRRRQEQARFIVGQLLQRMQVLTRFIAIVGFFPEDIDIGPGPGG